MEECLSQKMKDIMSRILEVRYTDLEEEYRLCNELLSLAIANDNLYARAFSVLYLGDYYLAIYDEENSGKCLLEAESIIKDNPLWSDLSLRLYSLFGIYYDIKTNEQKSIESYLKAINIAEKEGKEQEECIILNNLAFVFQKHGCHKESLSYYMKAYNIQRGFGDNHIKQILLGNLAEVSLLLGDFIEAKKYIEECDLAGKDTLQQKIQSYRNWCGYYCAIGDKKQANIYAKLLLENKELINKDKLVAFEIYTTACNNMMNLGEGKLAGLFLQAMSEVNSDISMDRMKVEEDTRMRYTILFEPTNKHSVAYRRFYEKNKQYRAKVTETVVTAMKSKIYLEQLKEQTALMESEKASLEQEVLIDELTSIYNRRFLERKIRENKKKVNEGELGFIIIDVDYFKEYNDYYGHIKGDMVLKEIASCLKENSIKGIYPCRYGGDEFVCICECVSDEKLEEYIINVRDCLEFKFIEHEKSSCSNRVTTSIGYANENKVVDVHLLFQFADQALYDSKRLGRNMYTRKRVD